MDPQSRQEESDRQTRKQLRLAEAAAVLLLVRRPLLPLDGRVGDIRKLIPKVSHALEGRLITIQRNSAGIGLQSLQDFLGDDVVAGGTGNTLRAVVRNRLLAERFANDWANRVRQAENAGAKSPFVEAHEALEARLKTMAVSESSKAFNGARHEAVFDLPSGMVALRRWDALMDACSACFEQQGEVTYADSGYSSGEEPGDVHPNCRCCDHYMIVTRSQALALL